MQNELKQFGAKATESFKQLFSNSIINLTIIYTLILAIILFLSSSIIYTNFSSRLNRRFALPPRSAEFMQNVSPTPDEVREDLINTLFAMNSLLLLAASLLSYWLAKITLKPIAKAYDKQREFLSDASHELRTPLSILQIELENELNDTKFITKDQIQSHLEEVNRMNKIVNNLLTLSRLDEDKKTLPTSITEINLNHFINELVKRLSILANKQQIKLTLIPPNQENDLIIISDIYLLEQIINNLLINAILYNQPNGQITIKLNKLANYVSIEITDTGIGIHPNDLKNIFERFYRVDKSRSRQTGGSGLGLSIVYAAVTKLGGSINIDSELNKGTTIKLKIPNNSTS